LTSYILVTHPMYPQSCVL